jgi:hypothetical protein
MLGLISPTRKYAVPDLLHLGGYEILTLGIPRLNNKLSRSKEPESFEYGNFQDQNVAMQFPIYIGSAPL